MVLVVEEETIVKNSGVRGGNIIAFAIRKIRINGVAINS